MAPILISQAYKFNGHLGSKGAIFHGGFYVDADGMYLIHNSVAWESAGTASAAFGLLGMLIHHFMTRKKVATFPLKEMPVDSIGSDMMANFQIKKMKDTATLAIIPKSDVIGYKSTTFGGTKFHIGELELVPIAAKGAGIKQLKELEYPVLE